MPRLIQPTLEECKAAFAEIVNLLDGEFQPKSEMGTHDWVLEEASAVAYKVWNRIADGYADSWLKTLSANLPKGMAIDHIDGNPRNDSPENLRVVTVAENFPRKRK